jgi:hypothetical protein
MSTGPSSSGGASRRPGSPLHIVVTIQDSHFPQIQSVANALKRAGLRVTKVMPTAGIVTGEIAATKIDSLTAVAGVLAVEPDREMRAI